MTADGSTDQTLAPERLTAAGLETMKWAAPRLMLPRHLCFKTGSLAMLKRLGAHRPFVMTGASSLRASGTLDKLLGYLNGPGASGAIVYDRIASEPTWPLIQEGLDAVRAAGPDWIIGIGGGAVLDAAKVIYARYEQPDTEIQTLRKPFGLPPLQRRSRLVLIPTTAGTGSEVSSSAVIQNDERQAKEIVVSHELLPDIALLDPSLTVSLPPATTAHTGMDALTHAMEAFVSIVHNPFTDASAAAAVRLLMTHLAPAFRDGRDLASREGALYAASLAGIAQNNVSVGLTHAIAHTLGAVVKHPHGLLNSLALLPVLRFNAETERQRYEALASSCGYEGLEALVAAIEDLQRALQLPATLRAAGAPVTELRGRVDRFVRDILADPCVRTNPRRPEAEDVRRILEAALA